MKKPFALVLGAILCLSALTAAGGSAGDPLISLSYLEGDFVRSIEAAAASRMDAADAQVRAAIRQMLEQRSGAPGGAAQDASAREAALKEGDVLSGTTGLVVTPLGGDMRMTVSGGAVVDVTEGAEVPSGRVLAPNHRYIVAENASASFTVVSAVAVASYEGGGLLAPSARPDYFAIARALRSMNLFQGSGSGFGEGFDLHLAPTRGEGLVMFIRILGEEADALSCEYSHPFTDVPAWLDRYVAWAYAQGYANGVAPTRFGCQQAISAVEFEEFLLRALGYSIAGVHDYSTSLERALNCGALTNGEYVMLTEEPFLRAQAAYVAYYSLDVAISGQRQTLAQRLTGKGVMSEAQLAAARASVETLRIY